MNEAFVAIVTKTQAWLDQALETGWLTKLEQARFASIERQTPADLFMDQQQRPLVVALFGGTGVGKSSLLNRLAGEPIARTGVERPTSREVTIYAHDSIKLAELPPELPVDLVNVKRHWIDERRDILWIDAPDIDSTQVENRRLALAWLPHVDLLIYVVSPERYRDDVGWRMLRQRGERHGWMFVINRWDEGDARQTEDFAAMLRKAGFSDPVLLCTSCVAGDARSVETPTPDEFPRIESAIRKYLAEHGVRELERLGYRARLLELRGLLNETRRRFGDDEQWENIEAARKRHWRRTRDALTQGLEWPIREIAGRFAVREGGLLGQVVRHAATAAKDADAATPAPRQPSAATRIDTNELTRPLWDEWTDDKVGECLDAIEVDVRRMNITANPLRERFETVAATAEELVSRNVQECLRAALSRPGTRVQRAFRRVTGFMMTVLPMLSLLWVGYNVVTGYYRASIGAGQYLGTNFAVSSVLLVLISWAAPYVVDRMLRPSLERAALGAMRQGLGAGLDQLGDSLRQVLGDVSMQAGKNQAEISDIAGEISRMALESTAIEKESLSRLLITPKRHSSRCQDSGSGDQAGVRSGSRGQEHCGDVFRSSG